MNAPETSHAASPVARIHAGPPDSKNCSGEDAQAELERILGSPGFDASERNRNFLEYVVAETLAGRADRIKAYNIATEVFGRDVNFDPQLDPVVRMEARRLRRSLERFYLTDGKGSLVRITMPKGGYVPEFQKACAPDPSANRPEMPSRGAPLSGDGSSIDIGPFAAEGDRSAIPHFNDGFRAQLIVGLSRFPEINVFGPMSAFGHAAAFHGKMPLPDGEAEFVLTGSIALYGGMLNIKAMLVHARTGRVVWGRTFERSVQGADLLRIRDDIANSIVRILAQPCGMLSERNAGSAEGKAAAELTPSECLVRFHQYRRSYSRHLFPGVRQCLERLVSEHPSCAAAFASLSQTYSDGHRFGFATGEPGARLRHQALASARRAIELSPDGSAGYHALGVACWFLGDVPTSVRALQRALALNPNAMDVMADLGLFWSLLGNWERGLSLLDAACRHDQADFGTHRIGLSLHHFVNGRFEDALADAMVIEAPDVSHGFVARAISQIRLGRKDEAAAAVARIVELAPPGRLETLPDLAGKNISADLSRKIGIALYDAGLATTLRSGNGLAARDAPEGRVPAAATNGNGGGEATVCYGSPTCGAVMDT